MTTKQVVATGLIASLSLAVIIGILEPYNAENWYTLIGLAMFVFGIWASILLLKD